MTTSGRVGLSQAMTVRGTSSASTGAQIYQNVITIPHGTADVSLGSILYGPTTMTSPHPGGLTAPTAGRYLAVATMDFADNGVAGWSSVQFDLTGSGTSASGDVRTNDPTRTAGTQVTISDTFNMAAGDYVFLIVGWSAGALPAGGFAYLALHRIGDIVT